MVFVGQKLDAVRLSVQDTGIGIASEHQERCLNASTVWTRTIPSSPATGLGLSIVKHAVQYYYGKIEICSEREKGTCVSVEFPR